MFGDAFKPSWRCITFLASKMVWIWIQRSAIALSYFTNWLEMGVVFARYRIHHLYFLRPSETFMICITIVVWLLLVLIYPQIWTIVILRDYLIVSGRIGAKSWGIIFVFLVSFWFLTTFMLLIWVVFILPNEVIKHRPLISSVAYICRCEQLIFHICVYIYVKQFLSYYIDLKTIKI